MEYYHIVVIGCGGTGSALLPWIARYAAAKSDTMSLKLSIVDGDAVEYKNLARQIFNDEDAGRNKAFVFSEALAETFGTKAYGYSQFINGTEDLDKIFSVGNGNNTKIIVGCVDNAVCRSVLKTYFYETRNDLVYIDTGNDYLDGQCVVGIKKRGVIFSPTFDYYFGEDLTDQKARADMSCTELNAATPQHFAVNLISAWCAFSVLVSIFESRPMRGLIKFDASKMEVYQEDPERYGFSVDHQVRNYLRKSPVYERLNLAYKGQFLPWLAEDEDLSVQESVLAYISKNRLRVKLDEQEKLFRQLIGVLEKNPALKKNCIALKGQITRIRKKG